MVDELHSSEAPTVDVDRRLRRYPRQRFLKLYVCFLYIYIYIYIYYMLMYIYVNCLRFSEIAMFFFLLGKGMMMDDVDRKLT